MAKKFYGKKVGPWCYFYGVAISTKIAFTKFVPKKFDFIPFFCNRVGA